MTDTAEVVHGLKIADGSTASPARTRSWRVIDRLGERIIRDLLRDSRAGATQRVLAARYGISVSSVKRAIRRDKR